jgi:hypothetical protein
MLRYQEGIVMTAEGDDIDILLDDDSEQTVSLELSSNKLIVEQTILEMGGEAAAVQASQLSEIAKELWNSKKYRESGKSFAVSSVFFRCSIKIQRLSTTPAEASLPPSDSINKSSRSSKSVSTLSVGSRVSVDEKLGVVSILNEGKSGEVHSLYISSIVNLVSKRSCGMLDDVLTRDPLHIYILLPIHIDFECRCYI